MTNRAIRKSQPIRSNAEAKKFKLIELILEQSIPTLELISAQKSSLIRQLFTNILRTDNEKCRRPLVIIPPKRGLLYLHTTKSSRELTRLVPSKRSSMCN